MRPRRRDGFDRGVGVEGTPAYPFKEIDMKKTLCAMKAALGIRGIGGCQIGAWRWVYYHNI